ncbi:MAG: PQQ-binding-like beta-propeller repeat protein [Limisphaerales bacterium]
MRVNTILLSGILLAATAQAEVNWSQFRGPNGDGHAQAKDIPLKFGENQNVKWKTRISGQGWSSPVIHGDHVWMQTALDSGRSLRVVCVDKNSGKKIHGLEVFYVPEPEKINKKNSHASPTPVLENGRCYVFFGMYGVAAIDTKSGKILWKNQSLKHDHDQNGAGSSPIIYKDLLILNCDGTDLRYVAAVNKKTGKLVWRTNRSNDMSEINFHLRKAYNTPEIIKVNGKDQLVSVGAQRVNAYDPNTGKEIWYVDIPGFSNVPRPVYGHGLVYIATGYMKPQMWAIDPTGKGNVTSSHVKWRVIRQAPAKPSPILVDDIFYMVSDGGILTALEPKTGKEIYQERLRGKYSASPVYVDGHIYFCGEEGAVKVLKPGREFKIVAESNLPGGFMASPAFSDNAMYLRSKTHLYRIQK